MGKSLRPEDPKLHWNLIEYECVLQLTLRLMKKVALIFVNRQMISLGGEPTGSICPCPDRPRFCGKPRGTSQWTSLSELCKSGSAEDNRWRACCQDLIGLHRVGTEGNKGQGGMKKELRAGEKRLCQSTEKSGMDGTDQQCTWPVGRIIFKKNPECEQLCM